MPLRLANKERSYAIEACGVTFRIISMSIGEKEVLVTKIQTVGQADGAFDRLLDAIAPALVSIDGYDGPPRETLQQLEEIDDLGEIIHAVIAHCTLSEAEAKNLSSSPAQPIPDSAGNVGTPVNPEKELASTIPTQPEE